MTELFFSLNSQWSQLPLHKLDVISRLIIFKWNILSFITNRDYILKDSVPIWTGSKSRTPVCITIVCTQFNQIQSKIKKKTLSLLFYNLYYFVSTLWVGQIFRSSRTLYFLKAILSKCHLFDQSNSHHLPQQNKLHHNDTGFIKPCFHCWTPSV